MRDGLGSSQLFSKGYVETLAAGVGMIDEFFG